MTLQVKLTATAQKYFDSLDQSHKRRIQEKLKAIAEAPFDSRLSKPLTGFDYRTARVGDYRIIFEIDKEHAFLIVYDIGPRGQIYKRMRR